MGRSMNSSNINIHDKFYTSDIGLDMIKESLYNSNIDYNDYIEIIDPCAGNGEFSTIIPITHQYDISPDNDSIIKMDFFDLELDYIDGNRMIVCSPPFGKKFELGRKFLYKASILPSVKCIASIVSKNVEHDNLIEGFELVYNKQFNGKSFIDIDNNELDLGHYFCVYKRI